MSDTTTPTDPTVYDRIRAAERAKQAAERERAANAPATVAARLNQDDAGAAELTRRLRDGR